MSGSEHPSGEVVGGHFRIEASIGRGGMGEVYRARDLRLGRDVALKLDVGVASVDQLRREAGALARLAHPNVVVVYEVGEHAGAPFVAMELVGGGTARTWRDAAPRTWREILDLYVAAGRGLAAAHAAGLVHRDVKPDNILVGVDGRARIGDFGIAREATVDEAATDRHVAEMASRLITTDPDADPSAPTISAELAPVAVAAAPTATALDRGDSGAGVVVLPPHASPRTAIVGTPRYMAPEQAAGIPVDARADQFSYCVALYEALCGVHPFDGAAVGRRQAIARGLLAAPVRRVPRRVVRAVARGLAAAPAARWPSMDALLAAVERAAHPRGRRTAAVAVAAAAALALTAAVWPRHATPADPCARVDADLSRVWGPARRDAVRAALAPIGADAAASTVRRVDGVAAEWSDARRRACVAAPADPAWSRALLDTAAACLAMRSQQLDRAVARLAAGDLAVDGVTGVLSALTMPGRCADPRFLTMEGPVDPDPARRAVTERLLAELADAELAAGAGHVPDALARSQAVLAEATRRGDGRIRRWALYQLGDVEEKAGNQKAAGEHLRAAFFEARAVGHAWIALDAARLLAFDAARRGDLAPAAEWAAHARAEAAHLDLSPENRVALDQIEAMAAEADGRIDDALVAIDRGIATLDAAGTNPAGLATLFNSKAVILGNAGRHVEAIAASRRALALAEAHFGASSAELLDTLYSLGLSLRDIGLPGPAEATLRRAYDIAVATLPEDSGARAVALLNYAAGIDQRDPAAAAALLEQALVVYDRAMGRNHPDTLGCLTDLANDLTRAGRPEDALRRRRDALAVAEKLRDDDAIAEQRAAIAALEKQLRRGGKPRQ